MTGQPPDWVANYVGLPFLPRGRTRDGLDCYGLLRLVLLEQFGIEIPLYGDEYTNLKDVAKLGDMCRKEIIRFWDPKVLGEERAGDPIVIRMKGQPMHVGIVVAPGWMLHIEEGIDSSCETYRQAKWECRISGFYRART